MFGWGVYPQHSWKLILHKWWFHRINYEACNIIHVYFNYHIINLKLNCFSYFVNLKETEQCSLFVYQSNPSTIRNQNYTTKISEHKKNEWNFFLPSDGIGQHCQHKPYLYPICIIYSLTLTACIVIYNHWFLQSLTIHEQIHKIKKPIETYCLINKHNQIRLKCSYIFYMILFTYLNNEKYKYEFSNFSSFLLPTVPITIFPTPAKIVVQPGMNAFLHCQAYGNPRPRVDWSRDGYDVSRDPRFSVYPNGTLIIQRTLEQDMGSYLCVANNGVSNPAQRIVMLQLRGMWTDSTVAFWSEQPFDFKTKKLRI